jgi:hypothetical protein
MKAQAKEAYGIDDIVERYMACVEEIINIPILLERFDDVIKAGKSKEVLNEIVIHSKVEFHYTERTEDVGEPEEQLR